MGEETESRAELTFGEELRREREIRGISLREIADATKISKRFLEAIEHNDVHTLPAPVFSRGFVREYARYLGLNADDFVTRYADFVAAQELAENTAQALKDRTPIRPVKAAPRVRAPLPRARINFVVLIILLIPLLALAAFFRMRGGFTPRLRKPSPAPAAPAVADASATPTLTSAPEPPPGLTLTVKATEESWVELSADGKTVFAGSLKAGEAREFSAADKFDFKTIGNAGGVTLILNGRTLPPLGESGEVIRNRTFDRTSAPDGPSTQT